MGFTDFIISNFNEFLSYTGFANAEAGNLIMIIVGIFFIWLAIKKDFEPLLLVPIGLGIILGNIPFRADAGLEIGLYEDNSVLNIFYQGVRQGWYPPLVFLGIGAMTDFSALISNPKLILIGAAAQFGIFGAYMFALALGFEPNQAAGIAIIGGADGPTAIFLSSKLCSNLMGAIAVCAGGSGTVRVGSGKARAGIYQGSLLLSTPGQPHDLDLRPCEGSQMKSGQKNAKAMTRVITQNGNNSINSVMEQKMTINGVSTCTIAGAEKYEKYQSGIGRKRRTLVQYDYRHADGELFSCVCATLEECRKKRDEWMKRKEGIR